MLRQALFLARKDVRFFLRQRETLLWTFVMPVLFFYFIGTITGGFRGRDTALDPLALVAPADAGFLADQLVRRLEQQAYAVVRPGPGEDLASYPRRLELPPGFTAAVQAGTRSTVTLVLRNAGIRQQYDQVRVGRALYTVLADWAVGRERGLPAGPELFAAVDALPRSVRLEVASAGERVEPPGGFEQTIPGTTVMFTLTVLLTSGSVLLVVERREGLLRRLAAAPMRRETIVFGKWLGRMALAVLQLAFALIAGTLLFKMDWGPHWPTVLLVLVVYAGLNASLGLLLGSLARSEGQAVAIGVLAGNVLAALGGCWWPIEVTPRAMQRLALLLPTGWTMNAMHRLISFGRGPASVTPHLLVTAFAALVAGWAAARAFRFQ